MSKKHPLITKTIGRTPLVGAAFGGLADGQAGGVLLMTHKVF